MAFNSESECATGDECNTHGRIVETGPRCALLYSNPDFMWGLCTDRVKSEGRQQTNSRPGDGGSDQCQAKVFRKVDLGKNVSPPTRSEGIELNPYKPFTAPNCPTRSATPTLALIPEWQDRRPFSPRD